MGAKAIRKRCSKSLKKNDFTCFEAQVEIEQAYAAGRTVRRLATLSTKFAGFRKQ
jgi:hypothetical protein